VREYLNSPPDLEGDHLTTGRDLYITFLQEAEVATGLDLSEAIGRLRESVAVIPRLAEAIRQNHLEDAATLFRRIAQEEAKAYAELSRIVGATGLSTAGEKQREGKEG
jgi:hypothetical protein